MFLIQADHIMVGVPVHMFIIYGCVKYKLLHNGDLHNDGK